MNLGLRLDKDDKEAAKERKEIEKQRDILVDALLRKYSALGLKGDVDGIGAVASELKKWVDIEDIKYFDVNVEKFKREVRFFVDTLTNERKCMEIFSSW